MARRNGVAPKLLFPWPWLKDEGGAMVGGSNEAVVGASEVRRLGERLHDLKRLLGSTTMNCEWLRC